ncbi:MULTISPECIES: pyrroline-5-carboxylate reductase [Actinomyces]|uniref:Pyrroline-5-carboxylate reductase n=2 Tax=Actinomyces respiraculi TaxID=2744574 RepID=A0A7T0PX74_9ACTO|nr:MULTISPECIES: pyrroline-5-carboxylate reductase [Actinomyces]QPL06188.1 pyrroline-5-carboxylate reductase [Actinomyces respiraculi]
MTSQAAHATQQAQSVRQDRPCPAVPPGTTIGFIGAGNMAGAIVRGAVAAGLTQGQGAARLLVTSPHGSAAALAGELAGQGVEHVAQAQDLVHASDVVVLGVKPTIVPVVFEQLREELAERRALVVSLAAGLTLARLEEMLPEGARVVRAMPNVAAAVGASMTALAASSRASEEDLALVEGLMAAVGRTARIAEKDFSAFVGLAGSSPAFVFTFIEALARAGVLAGIPKAQAVDIVTQAVLGSALTVQADAGAEDGRTPTDLVDAVCSPGGTTVAGLVAMERAGFSNAVIEGVRATVARDHELGA